MVRRALVGTAAREFEGADLGDRRRSARLTSIACTVEEQPARGFPRLLGSDAALEAFYRFINNRSFGAEDIVAPHFAATAERAAEAGVVVECCGPDGITIWLGDFDADELETVLDDSQKASS